MNTWNLSPLLNKREYTDNEKIVLNYFFTNIDKNIYCAKNTLSSQLWAFLMGQYSRTHISLRDRFLQLFEDAKKALNKWVIGKEDYVSLEDLANDIKNDNKKSLEYFENKASNFLKKWGVQFGHNSLKDTDRIRYAIEGISQVSTKIIESPFPPLGDFQEKSTRYIPFGKENLIIPNEIKESKYWKEIIDLNNKLIDVYEDSLMKVKQALIDNNIFKKNTFGSEKAYENTLNAKTFDICRYLLPSSVSTSLGASFSTRTLEAHLTHMLSHPLSEIRMIAKTMHKEWLKLSPWLLKHVWENEFKKLSRQKTTQETEKLIDKYSSKENEIHQWLTDSERVTIIHKWDLDNNILASCLFERWRKNGISYKESLEIINKMSLDEKENLMNACLGDRWQFDRMPRALQHTNVMLEFLVDFGAYRDLQRHRASQQLRQWASSIHGYDYPEMINLPWMEEFKKNYDKIMIEAIELGGKIIEENIYLLEYSCALWHLIRTTFEMNPGQLAYVIELRTTPQWHHSYRNLFIETYNQISTIAPIFSKYIRVGNKLDKDGRRKQEEIEAKNKEKLWL